ncbi:uncharacterized protein LOC131045531 [Cryptomeria japonica]|uniref:uncharacterized protein LOC131045531 n=1 Tax=Cryptomeria japonica TaxID=3369 RepID=UPI0025AB86BB|nr:uncharacterized protein LOC131045531 [Cryptomeria japonica]
MSPSCLVWEIWKERNRRLFEGKAKRQESILNSIKSAIVDSVNCRIAFSLDHSKVFSSSDENIRLKWQGIRIPSSFGQKINARKDATWSPPKPDWVKLNFDGASRGNPGLSGIGYVIKDQSRAITGKMAKLIPPDTNNIAEFTALQLVLMDCINHGLRNVSVEGDSEIAINAIRKKTPNWRLQAILEKNLENLTRFEHFEAKHIYGEANVVADAL